jgi:hypothetical protein
MIKSILNAVFYYGNFIIFYLVLGYFFFKKVIPALFDTYIFSKKDKANMISNLFFKKKYLLQVESDYLFEKRRLDILQKKMRLFLLWKKQKDIKESEMVIADDFFMKQKEIGVIATEKNIFLKETKNEIAHQAKILCKDKNDIDFINSFFSQGDQK